MGRQWLHAKRLVAGLKKGRTTGKLVREISVAAKMGGADPTMNARLFTAVEKAKKESVTKDAIQRAINKGAGIGDEKLIMEHVVFEGKAPHNVPVIVEVYTDNVNRTAPEMRVLFRKGQLGTSGSVSWDFDHVGIIEAEAANQDADAELAAIEAGAQDFEPADDEGVCVFLTDPTDLDLVSRALPAQGFTVLSAKLGYKPKNPVGPASLSAEALEEVEAFLAALDEHDDVQNLFAGLGG